MRRVTALAGELRAAPPSSSQGDGMVAASLVAALAGPALWALRDETGNRYRGGPIDSTDLDAESAQSGLEHQPDIQPLGPLTGTPDGAPPIC